MAITVVDLDTTKNCNLRCRYCFKSGHVFPRALPMTLDTAIAAVDWLIAASYSANQIWVNLMGGEPLLCFAMIKKLVPYAKRRAWAHGKQIQFGCTTNLTLLSKEVADFFGNWGMGWHCSIDGPPEVQDVQRPGVGGTKSSARAERGVKHVLSTRPGAMARATLTPLLVKSMFRSVRYFEEQGFQSIGFAFANEGDWTDAAIHDLDEQLGVIRKHARDEWYRKGLDTYFGAFDYLIEARIRDDQQRYQCGAGRGMVLIDERGGIWPCHRWDGADLDSGGQGAWRFGNIFENGFNHMLHLALLDRDRWAAWKPECATCPASKICAGGCPAANLSQTGSIYTQHDTNCKLVRIAYKHAMLLHDELLAEQNPLFMRKFYGKDYRRPDSYSPPVAAAGVTSAAARAPGL